MKGFLPLLQIFFVAFLVGCQSDIPDTKLNEEGIKSLRVALAESSRTALGEKHGNTYPLYWSKGDRIAINGKHSSEAEIDATDGAVASFDFDEEVDYPLNITYPIHPATTATEPKVAFPDVQSYEESTFALGSVPMCGYVANSATSAKLQHLSGVLRIPVKAEGDNKVLTKVVVTSTSKIAGDFSVNCKTGELAPHSDATKTLTYNLPPDFVLSADEARVLYIALPSVNVGTCTFEFFDGEGGSMVCRWNDKVVTPGVVREFKTLVYDSGRVWDLAPFEIKTDILITTSAFGYVKNSAGEPIEGVAVSDGFTIVTTDSDGYYAIDASNDCWYIYITVPAEYEIPVKNDQPGFYQKYDANKYRYDFTLKPLAGGKEDKFALFVLGDPQVGSDAGRDRLRDEAIPAIKAHAATWQAQGMPCYGITLGDLISNNNSSDRSKYRQDVFDYFAISKTGMPVFHVMGNHDNTYFNASNPLVTDKRSSTTELKAQRAHEEVCGPVNFSFDRGDMHIISMRNIVYNSDSHCEDKMRRAFLKSQYEWLKQDLALVPKDKAVLLCVHIPFQDGGGSYIDYTRNLISEYKEAHIMSGHSHLIQHLYGAKAEYPNIYEHNMGALCGAWWTSYMCGDGSPAGYGVFLADGTTFSDWYHIGYSATAKYRSHQMRLYRGNAVTGKEKKSTDDSKTKGYYAYNFEEDVLLANVYMADSKWKIEVYEDGEYSGEMVNISVENGQLANVELFRRPKIYRDESSTPSTDENNNPIGYMYGDGSLANPYKSSVVTSGDIYFSGYTNGVRGFNDWAFGTNAQCYHMYMYKLKKGDFSKVMVKAIDSFDNEYTETKITEGTDYTLVAY